jgi:hypothetical protein
MGGKDANTRRQDGERAPSLDEMPDFNGAALAPSSQHGGIVDPAWPVLDSAALHGLAGDFVRAIEPHTEADTAALIIQSLVAFGNAVGRGPHFRVEGDKHHANLFALLVGRTSGGRKGTSWGRIIEAFADADSAWASDGDGHVVSGLSSGEGLIWHVRDPIYETRGGEKELKDAGVEDKRLTVVESEFATALRVVGREGNTLSPIIRCAWDKGTLRSLTKNSPAVATGAHISIVGHITKDELLRYLSATETVNGFANRFLFACVKRSKCLPDGGQLSPDTLNSYSSLIRKALDVARGIGRMRRSEEARTLWHEVYEGLAEGKHGMFGAATSRAEAQVLRLSCIYALVDGSAVIEIQHLRAALALWNYCEQSCRYIFGNSIGYPLADRILEALRSQPGGLTRTEINNKLRRNEPASAIEGALRTLVEHGLAAPEVRKTGGRPEERWHAATKKTRETKQSASNGFGEVRP